MPKQPSSKKEKISSAGSQLLPLGDLLSRYTLEDKGGYITQEFQDFGYRIAMELGDEQHKSLYIKLAKSEDRGLLERALSFVKDAGAKRPGALFMWKLRQLRQEQKQQGAEVGKVGEI